jgi:2-succinyl-6-hydroxy-2,4-cyclohexadiene-1-carboxylate synthase
MRLATKFREGDGGEGAVPLVLVHGFTQTGESWGPVVAHLGRHLSLVMPDAPGHGGSSLVAADLWRTADLLADTVPGPASWAGYSMGGRMALHVALAHPEKVERLVLISATAGIDGDSQRQARRSSDDALAARIQRDGVEAFLAGWLAQPLFADLSPDRAGLEGRLANTAAGLASSLRLAGTGTQGPLWDRLAELRARALPVLLIAGERDTTYCQHLQRLAAAIGPSARQLIVSDAGHACHLEQPEVVAAALREFCPVVLQSEPDRQ